MTTGPDQYDEERKPPRYSYRRRAEDSTPAMQDPWMSGVPPWVKAIAVVGIPGAIAIFLVYLLATQVPKIEERQAAIEKDIELEHETQNKATQKNDQMFRLMQKICSNTAKTDEDRQRCFDQ